MAMISQVLQTSAVLRSNSDQSSMQHYSRIRLI